MAAQAAGEMRRETSGMGEQAEDSGQVGISWRDTHVGTDEVDRENKNSSLELKGNSARKWKKKKI